MNRQVKAALVGAAVVWAVFAVCLGLVGLVCLCAAHPLIGGPIALTLAGAFGGWLCVNDNDEEGW